MLGDQENLKLFKVGAVLGIIGSLWALFSILLAISVSPWFSWFDNALSDLGVSNAALIFNQGLIVCGVLCAFFAVTYVLYDKENKINTFGGGFLFMACIWLINIGVFTEDFPPYHYIFSVLFFVFVLISSLILGVRYVLDEKLRWIGVYSFIVGIIGIVGWALPIWNGVAIPESMTAFPTVVLVVILGARVLRNL